MSQPHFQFSKIRVFLEFYHGFYSGLIDGGVEARFKGVRKNCLMSLEYLILFVQNFCILNTK
jgi:hypothetical protein